MHHTILHAFNLGAFTLEWEERKRENGRGKEKEEENKGEVRVERKEFAGPIFK